MSKHSLSVEEGDVVRVAGRDGFWRVWTVLPSACVMIEDGPGMALGPFVPVEVFKATHRVGEESAAMSTDLTCAACGCPAEGNHSIERDGFGTGNEVDLCDPCGDGERPTLEEIWASIARRRTALPPIGGSK